MGEALTRELGDAVELTQPQDGLLLGVGLTGQGGKVKNAGEFAKRQIDRGVAFVPSAPFHAANPDVATFMLSLRSWEGWAS